MLIKNYLYFYEFFCKILCRFFLNANGQKYLNCPNINTIKIIEISADMQGKNNQITRIFPEGLPKAIGPYTPVTTIPSTSTLVFISGQIPINPQTNEIDEKQIEGQTKQVMKNLETALKGAGCNFSSIVKATILLSDINDFAKVNQIYGSYFEKDQYPARVAYAVKSLPKASLVEIEAIAVKNDPKQEDGSPSKRRKVQ